MVRDSQLVFHSHGHTEAPPERSPRGPATPLIGLADELAPMLEWVRRHTVLDVSINAVPVVIMTYFVAVSALRSPWPFEALPAFLGHALTAFPILVLVVATYYVARAVERDAAGGSRLVRSGLPSIYSPGGAFAYLMAVVAVTLVAAVGYLFLFAGASFVP